MHNGQPFPFLLEPPQHTGKLAVYCQANGSSSMAYVVTVVDSEQPLAPSALWGWVRQHQPINYHIISGRLPVASSRHAEYLAGRASEHQFDVATIGGQAQQDVLGALHQDYLDLIPAGRPLRSLPGVYAGSGDIDIVLPYETIVECDNPELFASLQSVIDGRARYPAAEVLGISLRMAELLLEHDDPDVVLDALDTYGVPGLHALDGIAQSARQAGSSLAAKEYLVGELEDRIIRLARQESGDAS
ncbi:hypothetical protein COY28_05675 [Candidatus Woesearchaeota archaeon CG_4_10_14_0_2_um_filter_57_5]|nr:MAG: hypothetical protein AUJ68_01510 [Candidatus Woesearchaeota archaeon CG1_02_57_44]PIN70020.1 MAG: hypothetical protein COV94_02205 [Candidatus Woesearchaeota archaeon CG11_big_fil_rev_8_21_14_0_20_57_5]PIZ50182.1 MAG: hypothetical protein COY28_05675 [Candidatus Woesearchaeota archaeon CG_4_10_14_0_2_um_filter_57_5]